MGRNGKSRISLKSLKAEDEESNGRNISRICIENGGGSAAVEGIEAREVNLNVVSAAEEAQEI